MCRTFRGSPLGEGYWPTLVSRHAPEKSARKRGKYLKPMTTVPGNGQLSAVEMME